MTITLTVLGSSGTWASKDSACSGYLIDDGTTRIWLDCGPGTLQALQNHTTLDKLDALVVSHEHPDHCLELPVVRNALKYGLGLDGLPLISPRGVLDVLDRLVGERGVAPPFRPRVVADGSTTTVGTLQLTFHRTDHPVETLAVRIDPVGGDPAFVYSADTGPDWSLSSVGDGIGLALVEGTSLASEEGGDLPHISARQAGEAARAAGAAKLVLTHVPPTHDPETHRLEAEAAFGAPVQLAIPHESYEV